MTPRAPNEAELSDSFLFRAALQHLRRHHPRVLFVSFLETDHWGHEGRYDRLLHSAHQVGGYVRRLWEAAQSLRQYRGKTTFVLVTEHGHGVRAIVVAFRGEEKDAATRRVAYLETYGQALKDALEKAKAARSSGKAVREAPPSRESELFRTNNLVRRVDETDWHVAGSPEGRRVMAEWRTWRAPDGREPVVCVP